MTGIAKSMMHRAVLLAASAAALAGCDAATQIAGEAVEGEVRNAVAAQCRQVAEGAGIVAARVSQVCECSANTFVADRDLTLKDVSRARIEEIVNACAGRTKAGTGATGEDGETVPTETSGG